MVDTPPPIRHTDGMTTAMMYPTGPVCDRLVPLLFRTASRLDDLGYDHRHRQATGVALLLDGEHDEHVAARLVNDFAEVQ
jgi:hypothetical protein